MRKHSWLIVICAIYLTLAGLTAHRLTPTVDEYAHLPAGIEYWHHGNFQLYSKNPPLAKLWLALPLLAKADVVSPLPQPPFLGWGPWLYGAQFEIQNHASYIEDFTIARWMNILVALSTGLLIYFWALQLGAPPTAATTTVALFLLSPTILAHGSLATLDLACCFTILLFCFYLGRIHGRAHLRRILLASSILGVALATKFTAVFLIPWFLIYLCLQKLTWQKRGGYLCASFFIILVTIAISYGFQNLFETLPVMSSNAGRAFARFFPASFPLPIPRAFIAGFDAQLADTESGEFGSYLFGEWSNTGWWYYNFAAFFLKESPLFILALIAAAFASIKNGLCCRKDLWIPFILIAVPMLFLNRLQIGIRYLIPLYPFMVLGLLPGIKRLSRKFHVVALAAVVVIAVSSFPNYISYFDPIVSVFGAPEQLLIDSNLDWGQDLYRLKGINDEAHGPIQLLYFGHVSPSMYGIDFQILPAEPVRGLIAVSANFLAGAEYVMPAPPPDVGAFVQIARDRASWLRTLKPIRREGSIFIYDTRQ